jgi:hypothetical protein
MTDRSLITTGAIGAILRHAVRKIAQTLGEENALRERDQSLGADRLVAQAADASGGARRDERLMMVVLPDLPLEREAG